MYILTVAHILADRDFVDVYLPKPSVGGFVKVRARVSACANATKVDLALLSVDEPPSGADCTARLAQNFSKGEVRGNALLIDITGHERPRRFVGELREHTVTWAGEPDDYGSTTYEVPRLLMLGGIRSANSGSPVFLGDELVGLNHFSPFSMEREDGDSLVGIGVTAPSQIRDFLEANDVLDLLER